MLLLDSHINTCGLDLFLPLPCSVYPSLSVCVSHSGSTRLEVCGSGVGQDFPLGLSNSVNIRNSPNLHPCSADVPQLTLMNTHTLTNILQQLILVFQFVFDYDLLIRLNKTLILYIFIVEISSNYKLLPPYSMVCSL